MDLEVSSLYTKISQILERQITTEHSEWRATQGANEFSRNRNIQKQFLHRNESRGTAKKVHKAYSWTIIITWCTLQNHSCSQEHSHNWVRFPQIYSAWCNESCKLISWCRFYDLYALEFHFFSPKMCMNRNFIICSIPKIVLFNGWNEIDTQ